MKLAYCACDKSGQKVADTIEAPDPGSAAESLRRRGLYVIEIAEADQLPARSAGGGSGGPGRTRRIKDLALFTRQLSVLVSTGTPLVQAIGALERQVKEGPWRNVISSIRTRLEEGTSLSEAMEGRREYFDSAYCSLVAAGESSGKLAAMLDRLAGLKQKQLHVRNSIIGAIVYPSFLTVIAAAVFAMLLVFVVPRFAELFDTLDVPLPTSTRILVGFSAVFRSYWWVMLAGLIGSILAMRMWVRTPGGRRAVDTLVLRLPKIGGIVKSFAVARITRLLGVLLHSHVPILEALKLTTHAASNVHYSELIARAEDMVARGEPIWSAFSDTDLVSPSVCEAVRNGEQSGQLGTLLLNVADFLDDENEIVTRSLTSIIEPVILVVLGLLVGVVAISLFLPLFDLTAAIQGGS